MNPYSLDTFIQPSFRGKGKNSPLFMDRICAVLGATPKEIRSQKNNKYAARRRWAIAYVMSRVKGYDIQRIAIFLHLDHSTLHHGLKQAEILTHNDSDFANMVDDLEMVA